jgi:nitrate reductase delta subunit
VQTFDMVPEHSLHLTHHLFGDDRGRGPALVDLSEHYKGMGLEMKEGEIPDYLPLILEYVATLDEVAARLFLADAGKVLTVLAANLENAKSRYAPLLRLVEQRGHLAQTAA